jgi:hypothetical protein
LGWELEWVELEQARYRLGLEWGVGVYDEYVRCVPDLFHDCGDDDDVDYVRVVLFLDWGDCDDDVGYVLGVPFLGYGDCDDGVDSLDYYDDYFGYGYDDDADYFRDVGSLDCGDYDDGVGSLGFGDSDYYVGDVDALDFGDYYYYVEYDDYFGYDCGDYVQYVDCVGYFDYDDWCVEFDDDLHSRNDDEIDPGGNGVH